ncbi:MAG TPA: quinol oxidase [Burkholderiales bacterium]|nr:quinol oxidase [Burkholderiales bacterium]
MQRLLVRFIFYIAVFSCGMAYANDQDKTEAYTATVDKDGIQHVRIIGGSYFFNPRRIVVKKGIPVELSVSKEQGITPHSIVANAPEAGIVFDESLNGNPKSVTFTATATGEYVFYCKNKLPFFPSHREKGMQGIFEVVE